MKFTKDDTKIIKGVALCLMLYHHLFAYPNKIAEGISFISLCSFGETALSTYIGQFGRICMPMFLFLSGYGTYLSSVNCGDVPAMARRRVWGLYKLVWQVFIISLPVSLWIFRYNGTHLIRETIYNGLGISCSFNEEWWFIVPFAVLLVLFPAVKRFLDRKSSSILTDFLFILLYSAFYNYIVPKIIEAPVFSSFAGSVFWHKMNETMSVFPAFFMGCIFAKYGILDRIKSDYAGRPLWCILALAGIISLFYLHLYNYMFYDFLNCAVFISCLTVLLPLRILKWPCRFLAKIAEESTFIWLTHTFFACYWCQKLVFAPKYSVLIFAFLLLLSYCAAKFIRFFWKSVGKLYANKKVHILSEKN